MEGDKNQYKGEAGAQEDQEVKSRGVFDFLKKKEDKDQEAIVSGMENVHVTGAEKMETETDEKKDEEKKEGLFAKLHRSDSSSSSSSDEEEVGPDGEKRKKKKGLKEKIKEKIGGDKKEEHDKPSDEELKASTLPTEHVPPPPPAYSEDTSIKVEKVDEPVKLAEVPPHDQEEKKGIIEKIKDKLPGQKKPEDLPATTAVAHEEVASPDGKEKKGILGKIMEKIKGPEQKEGENKSGESH